MSPQNISTSLSIKVDKDAFNVYIVEEASIPDYIVITDTSSQSGLSSPVEDPSVLMKLIQGKSPSMVDLRQEDDQLDLQTEMVGSMAGKMAKSQTLDDEPINAGEKDLLHVPMCTCSCHFSVDLDMVQSIFYDDLPSPTGLQPELGLSALLEQEMLDSQYEANMNKDVEALKKSKKGSKKLNKMDRKVLLFNEEDGNGVCLGELIGFKSHESDAEMICQIIEMERRDALMFVEIKQQKRIDCGKEAGVGP
ncbi:hypothetical protein Ancab_002555 [Ancistrocladus abbreviatus]